MNNTNLKTTIEDQLRHLGISNSTKGYYYFLTGILIVVEKLRNQAPFPYKGVYSKIKDIYNERYTNVTRGLNYSLGKAWENGNQKELKLILGDNGEPPTPLTVIMAIANKIYVEE